MLNIAAFMVVRDDEYYIDMALASVLPYVKGVYIQDQMSIDGTYEKACAIMGASNGKILIERVDTGQKERFTEGYNEPYWRTMAVRRCEDVFKPEWILKLDADEIYTPYFFENIETILTGNPYYNGVIVSGDRFISKTQRSVHPSAIEISPDGVKFVDPHTQVWRAQRHYYIQNPHMSGYFHPVMEPPVHPAYWLPGICNIHLHRIFGPKAYTFWQEGGEEIDKTTKFHAPTMAPKWFMSPVNMGCSEEVEFEWPAYVLRKWEDWGIW